MRAFFIAVVLALAWASPGFAAPPPKARSPRGLVAVLPLDTSSSSINKAARLSLEEALRTVAGDALGSHGYTVLTGETTLAVLTDNRIDPSRVCEASCALEAARELNAKLFISGTVLSDEGEFIVFIRLYENAFGQQLASLQLEGATVKEIRRAFAERADAFFEKAIRAEGGTARAAPEEKAPPAAAETPRTAAAQPATQAPAAQPATQAPAAAEVISPPVTIASAPSAPAAQEPPPVEPAPVVVVARASEPAPAAEAAEETAPATEAPKQAAASTQAGGTPAPAEVVEAGEAAETPAAAAKRKEGQAAAQAALLGPPDGLQLTVSWQLQAGLQIDESTSSAMSSLAVSTNYKLHPKVFFAGQISPYLELTPMPNDNRRADFSSGSSFARLNFRNLYTEKFSGITLGGNLTYFLPLSYNDWFTGNPRLGGLGSAVQLFRSIGPVTLIGVAGGQLPLFLESRARVQCDEEEARKVGASCPSFSHVNGWNQAAQLSSSLIAFYNVGSFSFLGQLQTAWSFTRGPGSANEPNNTNNHANQRFSQGFFLQGGYMIDSHWTVNAGLMNFGPQITGLYGRRNPFFDKEYAAVFVGVDWVR